MSKSALEKTSRGVTAAGRFAPEFMPRWLEIAMPEGRGPAPVLESLDDDRHEISTWAQARTVFTLAHLGLLTGRADFIAQAIRIKEFMTAHLLRPDGGCFRVIRGDGAPFEDAHKTQCRTYDFAFVLLGLVTLRKAAPDAVSEEEIARCWRFISEVLSDTATGALWESDLMARQGPRPQDLRAQNPHMHMIETYLQCFEMTGNTVWADRAKRLLQIGQTYFIEPDTGGVREFICWDLAPLATDTGRRCEPGHQYEWSWLVLRYRDLTGDCGFDDLARKMSDFAAAFGVRSTGVLAGAPLSAVDIDGNLIDGTHLLWPLTEAGKFHAINYRLTQDDHHKQSLAAIAGLIFDKFFAPDASPSWVNQLDENGKVIWEAGLTRVLYHMALFITEGAAAGVWPLHGGGRQSAD
jgi:mannose-6-phosphate isomerase